MNPVQIKSAVIKNLGAYKAGNEKTMLVPKPDIEDVANAGIDTSAPEIPNQENHEKRKMILIAAGTALLVVLGIWAAFKYKIIKL